MLRKLNSLLRRIIRHFLYAKWNAQTGLTVSKNTFIASSAQIQLNSDGMNLGGQVFIADGVRLSDGVILAPYGGSIRLEENVYIGPYCVLYGHGGLTIEKNTMLAGHCLVIPSNHNFTDVNKPISMQGATNLGITLGEDVWIGAGVRILDGVSIGHGCVVGAGAVVTQSLPDFSVAVGVPARIRAHHRGR